MVLLLRHQVVEVCIEALIARVPKLAIVLCPFGDLLDRRRLQATGSPLRLPSARDEPGALEHPKMFRDRRATHVEGFRELADGAFAVGQARENGAPSRVGE